jgi:hypothetical protein
MSVQKSGRTPISQKNRPLGLFITNSAGGGGLGGLISGGINAISGILGGPANLVGPLSLPLGMAWGYIFFLRPEEVTYTHPTRTTIVQTLGGAWVDDFGEGLVEITLSGHTGWRPGNTIGGEEAFLLLRNGCFQLYHQMRMQAAASGNDPDTVRMIFVDTLHMTSYVVYPLSMQTRKNKAQPLLYKYQLRLTGLERLI